MKHTHADSEAHQTVHGSRHQTLPPPPISYLPSGNRPGTQAVFTDWTTATLYKFLLNKHLHMADSTGTGTPKEHKVDLFRAFQHTEKGARGTSAGTETLQVRQVCARARSESVLLGSSSPAVVNISTRRFDTTSASVTRS